MVGLTDGGFSADAARFTVLLQFRCETYQMRLHSLP